MHLSPVYYSHKDLYTMHVLDICTKSAYLPGEAVLHELCCKRLTAITRMSASARTHVH